MPHLYTIFSIITIFSLFACKNTKQKHVLDTPDDKEYLSKADEVSELLAKRLGSQLKAALKSGGPEAGIQVCKQVAQSLTHSTNNELEGITVTRTSLKVRNPLNKPTEQDKQLMLHWQKEIESGVKLPQTKTIHNADQSVVVYKPILTQQICTKCHGEPSTFSPALISLIEKHYPEDKATGFSEGSLRGAFKVIFPKQ